MSHRNILITGGLGYIGSKLSLYLKSFNYNVRIIDINFFGNDNLKRLLINKKIELIEADIRDKKAVEKSLNKIHTVIHLAAISDDPSVELDPQLSKQVNFESSLYLLNKSYELGIKRFINASSSTVYGIKNEKEVVENLKLEPLSIYGKLKAKFEPFVKNKNDENFTTVSLRAGTVCGLSPRQRFDVLVNILTINALIKSKITINGGGQFRTNIHIDDLINVYKLILEAPKKIIEGEEFNVSFENYSVLETAKIVQSSINKKIELEIIKNIIDKRSYRVNSSKFLNKFKYTPLKTIKHAIIEINNEYYKGKFKDALENDDYHDVRKLKNIFGN